MDDSFATDDSKMQSDDENAAITNNLGANGPTDFVQLEGNRGADDEVFTGGATWHVFFDPEQGETLFNFPGSCMKNLDDVQIDADCADFMMQLQEQTQEYKELILVQTEHKRNGVIFRTHPQYRQLGQWHDWVLVDWGVHGKCPAEIWGFVDLEDFPDDWSLDYGGITVQNGVYAIIESADYVQDEDEVGLSDIFIPVIKEVNQIVQHGDQQGVVKKRKFYLADVEAFVEPIVVVPDVGSVPRCKYFHVKSRATWSNEFIKWIKMLHYHDEIDQEHEDEEDLDEE